MLRDTLKADVMKAMKAKNVLEKNILRLALGEVQTAEARTGNDVDDAGIIKILRKLVKSIGESQAAASGDDKDRLGQEIAVLERYLPKTLSVDAITKLLGPIKDQIEGAANDGAAIGMAMKLIKGTDAAAEGKDVSAAVRAIRA